MHYLPLLGAVDHFPAEHRIPVLRHAALLRQRQQVRLHIGIDQVLRQVGKHVRRLQTEALEALCIGSKSVAQVEIAALGVIARAQRAPGRRLVTTAAAHVRRAWISCSSVWVSAAKARMPSASLSVAMASSFKA